ncbi:MAG: hypothetical protein ACYSTZ_00010 [Planctomycetota bacterium]|jgi:hypothetical protein
MPDSTTEPIMAQLAEGANLALQARKVVNLYRVQAVKISNVTGQPCSVKNVQFKDATSAQLAKVAFMKDPVNQAVMVDDDAGAWLVTAKRQALELD